MVLTDPCKLQGMKCANFVTALRDREVRHQPAECFKLPSLVVGRAASTVYVRRPHVSASEAVAGQMTGSFRGDQL